MPVSTVTSGGISADGSLKAEKVPDAGNSAVRQVVELDHPEFDDLVLAGVEARGLGVEQDGGLGVVSVDGTNGSRGISRRSTR
jgi:hypothetical protein